MHARGVAARKAPGALASPGQQQRAPLAPRAPPRRPVKARANLCPYSTLGVASGASDGEIKQAYRKLVLEFHPDVNRAAGAEATFMTIQQAYELLAGKARGAAGADGRRSDWAFHDWYWSFMQRRRWGSYKKGAGPAADAAGGSGGAGFEGAGGVPPHKQPEHQATLRSQLAGLRHRAAIRARKQQPRCAGTAGGAAAEAEAPGAGGSPSLEYDSSAMGDGCNMASGVTDWAAAEQQRAAQRHFTATESHRRHVMQQMAGLHRRASAGREGAGSAW